MAVLTTWKKPKKEILSIFLADHGFIDFKIEDPDETVNRSAEGNEYILGICIDAYQVADLPRLRHARIAIYCKVVSKSSSQPIQYSTHITIDVLAVQDPEDSQLRKDCRERLIEEAKEIENLVLRTFPII